MMSCKITVFTPTYNRAHTLTRLYRSLQQQTFKDFEWLIIDDGSIDSTGQLVERWIGENNCFPLRYFKIPNQGKHVAINHALERADGKLFFTVDSDDFLTEDALAKINSWVASLDAPENFCGVAGNMGFLETETPNTLFPEKWRDTNLLERYSNVYSKTIDGERCYAFFTEVHRKYLYPVFENEKFMTEAVTWNRMANDGYKVRIFNDIICVYKYLEGGLTLSGNKLFIENPKGFALWLREKAQFCNFNYLKKFKLYYSFYASQNDRQSVTEIAENLAVHSSVIQLCAVIFKVSRKLKST